MRIIVSIQSKRGSSRGLVHYLAHSKIDPENEPERGRELFNRFGDSLDVKSANNYLKTDISQSRPSNEELHHLVLSFRPEDFERLGTRDRNRRRSLKQITRAAMDRLERSVNADQLAWTAAVHLNTGNPHVHIAIQKQYFNVELEKMILAKIPRDAIPHYRDQGGKEKEFIPGLLIEAAAEKMDEIIHRKLERDKGRGRPFRSIREKSGTTSPRERDAEILRKELLQKSALKACEKRIGALIERGHKMRFMVFDSVTGTKRRMSLEELNRRAEIKEPTRMTDHESDSAAGRRIRTILRKLTAREESKRQALEKAFKAVNREANAIRSACRKQERKLPTPALTKEELDRLQKQSLDSDDIRTFGYLERVRSELSTSRKIPGRDEQDLQELFALATIYDLRSKLQQNRFQRHAEHRYNRKVELNGTSLSLFELDKNPGPPLTSSTLSEKVRSAFGLQSSEVDAEAKTSELKSQVLNKLDEEDRQLSKRQSLEQKKAKLLRSALSDSKLIANLDHGDPRIPGAYLKDMETLSFRLKNVEHFERSWEMQRSLIRGASLTSLIGRKILKDRSANEAEQLLEDHKAKTIAGRAFAREIISRIQLDEARSELQRYSKFRALHKFEVADPRTGKREFVCLQEVEIPRSGSLLNQMVDYLTEGDHRRELRGIVTNAANEMERNLKDEVRSAKAILDSASKAASEYKASEFFGLRTVQTHEPIFTISEREMIERRILHSTDRAEVRRLEKILSANLEKGTESLTRMLEGFEPSARKGERDMSRLTLAQASNAREEGAVVVVDRQSAVAIQRGREPRGLSR